MIEKIKIKDVKYLSIGILFIVSKSHGRLEAVRQLVDEELQDFNKNADLFDAVLKRSSLRARPNTPGVSISIAVIFNPYRDFGQSRIVKRDAVMQKLCQSDRAEMAFLKENI